LFYLIEDKSAVKDGVVHRAGAVDLLKTYHPLEAVDLLKTYHPLEAYVEVILFARRSCSTHT